MGRTLTRSHPLEATIPAALAPPLQKKIRGRRRNGERFVDIAADLGIGSKTAARYGKSADSDAVLDSSPAAKGDQVDARYPWDLSDVPAASLVALGKTMRAMDCTTREAEVVHPKSTHEFHCSSCSRSLAVK